MFYKIAHILREHCSFVWNAIEWCNEQLFAVFYKKKLNQLPKVLGKHCYQYSYKIATASDASALASFFSRQPLESFTYFKPHGFSEHDLKKVCNNKSILTFVAFDNEEIIGYFFLRCFLGGKAFRGKIVDAHHQGQEIATEMGTILTLIAQHLHLRVFGSISPDNYASLASAKKSNNLKIIKTLENGYLFIEFLSRNDS